MFRLAGESRTAQTVIALSSCLILAVFWHLLASLQGGVLALLPLLLVLALRAPFILCLTFIAFSFFRLHEIFPILSSLHIPQLLAIAILFSLSCNIFLGRIKILFSRELVLFGFFTLLVTIGAFLATNRQLALDNLTGSFIKIAVMVLAISWLLEKKSQFKILIFTMLACGLITSAATLYNKINKLELVEGTRVTIGRSIGSMLGDPNDLALVLLFPAGFCLALFFSRGIASYIKYFSLLIFICIFSAIIATQSRGGLLGIAAVCGLFAWKKIHSKTLIFLFISVLLIALVALAGLDQRASGAVNEMAIDDSAMGRIYAWQAAFNMALDHPIAGVGLDNFVANYFAYSAMWDGQNHAVHSTWFGVLAETGILGFSVFVSIIYRLYRLSQQSIKYLENGAENLGPYINVCAQATQAGLLSFCVSGSFLTMGFTWPIYILLAISIGLAAYIKRQRRKEV